MSGADGSMRIGEILREGRRREGLEIVDVEQATKIRIKYLRALEAEEWDALPSPAYAKGFLRTYGQLLGLDGDALVDEYRRRYEIGRADQPFGPQPSRARRGPTSSGPPPMFPPIVPIVVGAVVVIGIVLALIGLLGDPGESESPDRPRQDSGDGASARSEARALRQSPGTELTLTPQADVAICLLDETPEPLVDGDVQPAGEELGPFTAERLTLRFPDGVDADQVDLTLEGSPAELESSDGPAAFRIEDGAAQPIDPPPASCP